MPDHLFLRPLTLHPFQYFLPRDAVALHDPLNPYFLGRSHHDDTIYQSVDARLEEDGTLHPLHATLLEVLEDGRVHNGVNGLGILLALQ